MVIHIGYNAIHYIFFGNTIDILYPHAYFENQNTHCYEPIFAVNLTVSST